MLNEVRLSLLLISALNLIMCLPFFKRFFGVFMPLIDRAVQE